MTRTTRVLLALLVAIPVVGTLALGAAATAVYRAGSVHVEIDDPDGTAFSLNLPAAAVRAAIAFAPADVVEEAIEEVGPFLPALAAGWDELRDRPDFVLLDVESRDGHVRVSKTGERLLVEVSDRGSKVRLGLPLRAVGALIEHVGRRLDGAAATAGGRAA